MYNLIPVTYTDSTGDVWDLQISDVFIRSANFHNWEFDAEAIDRRNGVRVSRFRRDAASYEAVLYFGGSTFSRRLRIDRFHSAIERDVRMLTPGRLTWRDWYLDCFITASSTYPEQGTNYTANEINVYAPYPFWIKPQTVSFEPQEFDPSTYEWLDYQYGYEHDYTPEPSGVGQIVVDAPGASEFQLVIFGPVSTPAVTIGGIRRAADVVIDDGDYLTIDSRTKTVIISKENGDKINAFNYRSKEQSIFTPIPSGGAAIIWSGTFGFDLTVFRERSEPAWT